MIRQAWEGDCQTDLKLQVVHRPHCRFCGVLKLLLSKLNNNPIVNLIERNQYLKYHMRFCLHVFSSRNSTSVTIISYSHSSAQASHK